jgi:hypothetical protein
VPHARTARALALATVLLAIGALAYALPRHDAPAPLAEFAGVWPSFWFAAGLVLAGTALARGTRGRGRVALGWTVAALATEVVQHPAVAALLFPTGPAAARLHPASYAHRGTFDPLDLIAIALGSALGAALGAAMARARRGGTVPASAGARRMGDLALKGALLAAATTATLATTAPPGPYVTVTVEPAVVCEGDTVRVAWTGSSGSTDAPPGQAVLDAAPGAVVPPMVGLEVAVPGALDVVALRSTAVAAAPGPYGSGGVGALLHARPCDAAGRQDRSDVAGDVVAIAPVPNSPDVVAALRGYGGFDRLVRLDADAAEVAAAFVTGDRGGRVRDLAVAPDGTVVAVGWRELRTETANGTEAVVWRWPSGGDPDAGTVVGPTAPGIFAEGAAVAVDDAGRTWVAWTEGPPGHTVAIVAAYAPDGALVATHTVAPGNPTEALGLALDAAGRPTLLGGTRASATAVFEAFVLALDAAGAPRWQRPGMGGGSAAIATGAGGTTLVLVGVLHALDATTGDTLWTASDPEGRAGTLLTVDDAGGPVVAGPQTFIQRYAPDGTPAGRRAFGTAHTEVPGAIAWSGGAVVAGATKGPLATDVEPEGSFEAFVLRFPDGAP